MKKLVISVLLIFLLLPVCLSCSPGRTFAMTISCDEFEEISSDMANIFEIENGDRIKANLCANPTTGFSWHCTIDDESIIKLVSNEYIEPDEELLGAAGTDVWIFESVASGETTVVLEYSRDWEGGEKAERTYTMDILVMESQQ